MNDKQVNELRKIEKAASYIIEMCEKSELKMIDTTNNLHMAIYTAIHAAKQIITSIEELNSLPQ